MKRDHREWVEELGRNGKPGAKQTLRLLVCLPIKKPPATPDNDHDLID